MRAVSRQPWFPHDGLVETVFIPNLGTGKTIEIQMTSLRKNDKNGVITNFWKSSSGVENNYYQWIWIWLHNSAAFFSNNSIVKTEWQRNCNNKSKSSKNTFFLTFSKFSAWYTRPSSCKISGHRIFWNLNFWRNKDAYFNSYLMERYQNLQVGSWEIQNNLPRPYFFDYQTWPSCTPAVE